MASDKQIEANKANAKGSTGPKSASGKDQSRKNALKHGFTAETIVIGNENPAEFELLRRELEEERAPLSAMERELVSRLAGILWRLRRALPFEASILKASCTGITPDELLTKEERHWRYRALIVARYRAAQAKEARQKAELSETATRVVDTREETKSEPPPFKRTIGVALTRNSRLLGALTKMSSHETALLNVFTRTLQLGFSLRTSNSKRSGRKNTSVPRVRASARKHLTDREFLVGEEDPAQFANLRADFETQFAPRTSMQREILHYAVGIVWRLRRVDVYAASVIEALGGKSWTQRQSSGDQADSWDQVNPNAVSWPTKGENDDNTTREKTHEPRSEELDLISQSIGEALLNDSQSHNALGILSAYEASLTRRLSKSLQLLNLLQLIEADEGRNGASPRMISSRKLPPTASGVTHCG